MSILRNASTAGRLSLGLSIGLLLIAGAVVFIAGIGWGLPSRVATDPFLFGNVRPWDGKQVLWLAGNAEGSDDRAADVSSRPLDRRGRAVVVNATDADRARIVRRYRLMSHQPDEFTTFKSLSEMRPGRGDLDPRMYKYGGLWVYPVGALLKAASMPGWLRLTPDAAYYLDHPEAFGRFYVVARLYSAAWGLLGVVAVFALVRRITANNGAAACAAICFILMPVVVTAAHEAKPHLAGTTLILLAVLAATRWVESGRGRWAIGAAVLCGAAIGMVPSALPVVLVLPAMQLLRRSLMTSGSVIESAALPPLPPGEGGGEGELQTACLAVRALSANSPHPNPLPEGEGARGSHGFSAMKIVGLATVALFVYCLTNPYVPTNLVRNRALLRSNFGNSSDFYHAGGLGLWHGLLLIGLGGSFVLAITGGIGAIALAVRAARTRVADAQESRRRAAGMMLAVVTIPVGLAFVIFAGGQPADYARFALPFDVFLAIEGVVAVATFVRGRRARAGCYVVLVGTTAFMGLQYVGGFVRDARAPTSRTRVAEGIASMLRRDGAMLASREEPAPWSLPPVDLFRWRIVLPPRGFPSDVAYPGATVTVGPADFPTGSKVIGCFLATPISWAEKPFPIERKERGSRAE